MRFRSESNQRLAFGGWSLENGIQLCLACPVDLIMRYAPSNAYVQIPIEFRFPCGLFVIIEFVVFDWHRQWNSPVVAI